MHASSQWYGFRKHVNALADGGSLNHGCEASPLFFQHCLPSVNQRETCIPRVCVEFQVRGLPAAAACHQSDEERQTCVNAKPCMWSTAFTPSPWNLAVRRATGVGGLLVPATAVRACHEATGTPKPAAELSASHFDTLYPSSPWRVGGLQLLPCAFTLAAHRHHRHDAGWRDQAQLR